MVTSLTRTHLVLAISGVLAAAAWAAPAHAAPKADGGRVQHVMRKDVSAPFAAAACDGRLGASPRLAWEAGVFDAQIEGRLLTPIAGAALTPSRLERKAKALARARKFGGYAFGPCPNGSGWVAAFPASAPLAMDAASGTAVLPVSELEERCASWRVDFAKQEGGFPKPVTVAQKPRGTVRLGALGDGVASVTCQPRAPRWLGPVVWYLLPTGKGPADQPPAAEALSGGEAPQVSLATWVNRVRTREGLAPLEWTSELKDAASVLTVQPGLAHDRLLLQRVSARLADQSVTLHGEDRVRGADATSMAWLLWTSPRHRDLLLRRDATAGGVSARTLPDGSWLAVVVTGAESPLRTARGGTVKRTK
jgi:hypothetical protein